MAELRSSDVLAKTPAQSRVLCLLDKVCPTESTDNHEVSHDIKSSLMYDLETNSYYHWYWGCIYRNNEQIDSSTVDYTCEEPGWTFTVDVDDLYNHIYLSGTGPTAPMGSASVSFSVKVSYQAADFNEYIIPCHLPRLHNYMCSLVKCVCGDFVLTNSDVVLENLSTITLSTEDKSYKIDMKLDFANQTISFHTDSTYDQSDTNFKTLNNKYFKTHSVSLYLYTIPVYYM